MGEHKKTPRYGTIAIACAVSFCLCGLAVRLLPVEPYHTDLELLVDFQADRLGEVGDGDVLLFGDSALGNAVDERALSAALGRRCWNFALVGFFGVDGERYLIDELRRRGARPAAVVIMHNPEGWSGAFGPRALVPLERRFGGAGLENAGRWLFERLSSVQKSRSMKALLFERGAGLKPDRARYLRLLERSQFVAASLPEIRYVPRLPERDWDVEPVRALRGFAADEEAAGRLRELLELAAELRAPVYLAAGPMWERQVRLSGEYIAALGDWLAGCSEGVPFAAGLLYAGAPTAPSGLMGDAPSHLNTAGAAAFSEWLAGVLDARLEDPESPPPAAWTPGS